MSRGREIKRKSKKTARARTRNSKGDRKMRKRQENERAGQVRTSVGVEDGANQRPTLDSASLYAGRRRRATTFNFKPGPERRRIIVKDGNLCASQ